MTLKDAGAVKAGDALLIDDRPVVVTETERNSREGVAFFFRRVIGRGKQLRQDESWTTRMTTDQVRVLGRWKGLLEAGCSGNIVDKDGKPVETEGEPTMATRTKTAAKKAAKPAAKKAGAAKKASERTRASNEELDALAEQVVDLRDNQGLAWGVIGEQLDVEPSRLRALYNRGGGQPSRKRGEDPNKPKAEKKSAVKKGTRGRKATRAKEDPSDED